MKSRVELAVSGVKTLVQKMLAPEMLSEAVYEKEPVMVFRMDGRDITDIAVAGGYTGREFAGTVRETRNYLLVNRPSIGYGGCVDVSHALKFSEGREPMNLHIHITCPKSNHVIVMPSVILRYHIGEYSPEPGNKCLTIQELLAEQEYLTVNDVPMQQFLASIHKDHVALFKEGIAVPNQLKISGVDESAPEIVTIKDCMNSTAMLLACLRQGCDDKATVIATKLAAERVLKDADKNGYCNRTKQELISFWNTVRPSKDKFEIPEDKGFVAVTASKV